MKRLSMLLLFIPLVSCMNVSSQDEGPPPLAEGEIEIVLEQGLNDYAGTRDATIYEEGSLSNGAGQHIFVGLTKQNNLRRTLIEFDLSGIPTDATITYVNFQIVISKTPFDRENADVSLHRLTQDWGEGEVDGAGEEGRGENAADGDATWEANFLGTSVWNSEGGDFVEDASTTARAGGTDSPVIFDGEGLIADIQSWLENPDSNHGWAIVSEGQAKRYHSSNGGDEPDQKPRLIVRYMPAEQE